MRGATVAECPRCGSGWPLFAQDDANVPDNASFTESRRRFERAGEETRRVDNRRGRTALERTITFTQEWQQSVKLDVEHARERGSEVRLSGPGIELAKTFEQSVKTHYEVGHGTTRTQTEQVTVTADPGRVTSVTLQRWNEWQDGLMRVPDGRGRTLAVPYSVIVGVAFDVIQEDVLVGGLSPTDKTP